MHRPVLLQLIDFVFPPHPDVRRARGLPEEALSARLCLSYNERHHAYTALPYRDEAVRAVIRANKYHHDRRAARLLGAALADMLLNILDERALERGASVRHLLVATPSSARRRRERGGNQVEWIIEAMPKEARAAFTYAPHALSRADRKSQTRVARTQRHANVRGAFFLPRNFRHPMSEVAGATVFLVDDVIESGATMRDAMRALKEAGAASVIGVALAT